MPIPLVLPPTPCPSNPGPGNPLDPAIVVDRPTSGATVQSPVTISGQARVFEAVVSIRVLDADGHVLVDTTALAAAGGELTPFTTDVAFAVDAPTPACIQVFEVSARDGEPTNVVQIGVTLQPPTA